MRTRCGWAASAHERLGLGFLVTGQPFIVSQAPLRGASGDWLTPLLRPNPAHPRPCSRLSCRSGHCIGDYRQALAEFIIVGRQRRQELFGGADGLDEQAAVEGGRRNLDG